MNYSNTSTLATVNMANASVHSPYIPHLDIQLPVTFAVKILLDIIGAMANACLLVVCYLKHQTEPNPVSLIIMQLVTCWLLLDFIVFPINDVITFLYNFGYHVSNNILSYGKNSVHTWPGLEFRVSMANSSFHETYFKQSRNSHALTVTSVDFYCRVILCNLKVQLFKVAAL